MTLSYSVGVDLGTTYSCAAVADGRAPRVVQLTGTSQTIPSVVSISGDETIAGEAAERRLVSHPSDTVREFKRRFGDPAPLVLGGATYGAEVVTSHLLAEVLRRVEQAEGTPPRAVGLAHPASWGPFRLDLLRETATLAGVDHVELVSEPVAAAVANRDRVTEGSLVAVYDLGGGTFDAAVVQCAGDWSVIGTPEGVERLGGVDFDQAILAHVDSVLDGQVYALDSADPDSRTALIQLRAECQKAKEHLSQDTDVEIPVSLPNLRTSVRLTRSEFEAMVRPRLADSLAVLDRVVSSAGVGWDDIDQVLLVGGSSNIPAVGQIVSEHTGRPVTTATNPHLAIAIGTAAVTEQRLAEDGSGEASVIEEPTPAPAASSSTAVPEAAPSPTAEAQRAKGGRPVGLLVGAGALVLALIVGAVVVFGGGGDDPDVAAPTSTSAPAATGAESSTAETGDETGDSASGAAVDLQPVAVDVCAADATGVNDIAIVGGSMFLLTDSEILIVPAAAVDGCSIDVSTATPVALDWEQPVTHIGKAGSRLALAGPEGGALAIAGRSDVVACSALTGEFAAASNTQLYVSTDAGLVDVAVDDGACPSSVLVPATDLTETALDASQSRLVVAGIDAEGNSILRMWLDNSELTVSDASGSIPTFGAIDAVQGCGDYSCVFETEAGVVRRFSETGLESDPQALPEPLAPGSEVLDSAASGGAPYLLVRSTDGSVQILRVEV